MSHTIKRNDTPTLQWSLETDVTGLTVKMIIKEVDSGTIIVEREATIVTASTGLVSLVLTAAETATEGVYNVEAETKSGTDVVLTHPNNTYESLRIVADLA